MLCSCLKAAVFLRKVNGNEKYFSLCRFYCDVGERKKGLEAELVKKMTVVD